jgi:hypothetical protein
MNLDQVKRNLRTVVEEVYVKGGRVEIGSDSGRPHFLLYDFDKAEEEGDNVTEIDPITPATLLKKWTAYQTIMRYQRTPLVIEVEGDNKAVLKVHPDFRSRTIEKARTKFLNDNRSTEITHISAKLDEVLAILKKKTETD